MSGTPTLLSDMLEQASRDGHTYEQLAECAVDPDTGTRVSRSNLNKIANGQTKHMPPPAQLAAIAAAIAAALELTYQRAYQRVWLGALIQFQPPGDEQLLAALMAIYEREIGANIIADALHAIAAAELEVPGAPNVKTA